MTRKTITLEYKNVDADKLAAFSYSVGGLKLTTVKDKRGAEVVIQLRSDITKFLTFSLGSLLDTIFEGSAAFDYSAFYFCRPTLLPDIDLRVLVPRSQPTVERISMTYNDMYSIIQYLAMFFGFVYGITHPAFDCYPTNSYELGLVNGGIYLNCGKSKCSQRLTSTGVLLDDRYVGGCAAATHSNTINISGPKNAAVQISQTFNSG